MANEQWTTFKISGVQATQSLDDDKPKIPQWQLTGKWEWTPNFAVQTWINQNQSPDTSIIDLAELSRRTNVYTETAYVIVRQGSKPGNAGPAGCTKCSTDHGAKTPHDGTKPYHYRYYIQQWGTEKDYDKYTETQHNNSSLTTYDFSDGGGMHTSSHSDSEEVINDALQSKDERYPNFDATQHMIMSQSFGKSSGMPSGEFALRNYQVEDEEEKLMNRHNYMLEFFRTQKTLTDIMTEYTARLGNLPDGMSDEDFVSKFSGYVAPQNKSADEEVNEEPEVKLDDQDEQLRQQLMDEEL